MSTTAATFRLLLLKTTIHYTTTIQAGCRRAAPAGRARRGGVQGFVFLGLKSTGILDSPARPVQDFAVLGLKLTGRDSPARPLGESRVSFLGVKLR